MTAGGQLVTPLAAEVPLPRRPLAALGEDGAVWLALIVAMAMDITTGGAHGDLRLVALAIMAGVLALALRWPVAPLAIAVLFVAGLGLRLAFMSHQGSGSDVLDVTAAAIRAVVSGQNPYGIGYEISRPPGAPYAYGPLALVWYWPLVTDIRVVDLVMAGLVVAALAFRGKLVGLAIYAMAPILIESAGDGSNDTSAGVLLLLTFVLARRRPVLGAVFLAATVAFKPYAAAWVPAFLLWGGWSTVAAFAVASVVLWSPVIFVWGIPSFLTSLDLANKVHHDPGWSFGQLYEDVTGREAPREVLNAFRLVLGAVTAIVTLRWAKSLDGVLLVGTVVYLVTLFMGFWATFGYFSAIAPVLCWRIDDWLGLPTRPFLARHPADVQGARSSPVLAGETP
jgi:hypothetical protein